MNGEEILFCLKDGLVYTWMGTLFLVFQTIQGKTMAKPFQALLLSMCQYLRKFRRKKLSVYQYVKTNQTKNVAAQQGSEPMSNFCLVEWPHFYSKLSKTWVL